MKLLRALAGAAGVLAMSAAAPAFAGTSELQQGSFNVPYACSVSPVSAAMTVSGTSAAGGGANAFNQNSDTIYSLSPVTYTGPLGVNNGNYSGSVTFVSAAGTGIVSNGSTAIGSNSGVIAALRNETGSTQFSFSTAESAFRAGNYTVASTLSCAQREG